MDIEDLMLQGMSSTYPAGHKRQPVTSPTPFTSQKRPDHRRSPLGRYSVEFATPGYRPPPVDTNVPVAVAVNEMDTPHAKLMEVVSRNIPLPKDYKTPKPARKPPTASIKWTPDEDQRLREIVKVHGAKNWRKVAELLGTVRTDVQCQHRWNKVLKPGLQKGPWTPEEDKVVMEAVAKYGVGKVKWSSIAHRLPGRIGKQCRERWFNHLDPSINRGDWTPEEDRICHEAHKIFGNRWKEIAKLLPGRTENAVKNRFNSASFRKWVKDGARDSGNVSNSMFAGQQHPQVADAAAMGAVQGAMVGSFVSNYGVSRQPPALSINTLLMHQQPQPNLAFSAGMFASGATGAAEPSASASASASASLAKLSYFRFLDRASQRAVMKQLIDCIEQSTKPNTSSDASAMELTSIATATTTTSTPISLEMLRAHLPPASPTTLSMMLSTGQEVLHDHGNDSTSDLSTSGELTLSTGADNGVENLLLPKEELHGTFESLIYPPGTPPSLTMNPDWDNSLLSPRSLGGLVLTPMTPSASRFSAGAFGGLRDVAGHSGCSGERGETARAAAAHGSSSNVFGKYGDACANPSASCAPFPFVSPRGGAPLEFDPAMLQSDISMGSYLENPSGSLF